MATFKKRENGRWYVEVSVRGIRRGKTLDTKTQARSWALEQEQLLGKHGGLVKGKTLRDAFERYAKEVAITHKGAKWEIDRLNKFSRDQIADIPLQLLNETDIEDWCDRSLQKIKSSSVNREMKLLSPVIDCAIRWKWCTDNPVKQVKKPPKSPPRDRRISDYEIEQILEGLGYDDSKSYIENRNDATAVAFLFAIETAMRQGEIFKLEWERVFLKDRFVRLIDTKNGDRRDVPLSKRAIELLKKFNPQKKGKVIKYNQASCGQLYRQIVSAADIEDLTFHDTRHEALTRLAQKLEVLDLARMVGHRDPRSLMIYYNATASEIAERLD